MRAGAVVGRTAIKDHVIAGRVAVAKVNSVVRTGLLFGLYKERVIIVPAESRDAPVRGRGVRGVGIRKRIHTRAGVVELGRVGGDVVSAATACAGGAVYEFHKVAEVVLYIVPAHLPRAGVKAGRSA